jgi:hypothetical protein
VSTSPATVFVDVPHYCACACARLLLLCLLLLCLLLLLLLLCLLLMMIMMLLAAGCWLLAATDRCPGFPQADGVARGDLAGDKVQLHPMHQA